MACTRCGITQNELYQRGEIPSDPLVAFNLGFDRGRANEAEFSRADITREYERGFEACRQTMLAKIDEQNRKWREDEERRMLEWQEAQEPA